MNFTIMFRKRQQIVLLLFLCLPSIIYAQTSSTNEADRTPVSFMGRQMNRVSDPLSKNTLWIDKYATDPVVVNQMNEQNVADQVMFYFRVNSTLLEPNYMNNAKALQVIDKMFSDAAILRNNNNLAVIIGSASPEGNTELNKKLANERSLSIKNFITHKYPNVDRDKISTYAIDEDWTDFRKRVATDTNMPGRNQTLELLDGDLSYKQKLAGIKLLNSGNTYNYIKSNIFPYLRGGVSCTFYTINTPKSEVSVEYRDRVVEVVRVDTVYIDKSPAPTPQAEKPYYFALKNNLLYDAALLPNLAVEFPLGKRWSVELEAMESWWNTKNNKRYYHRIQTGGLEVRKWLGDSSKAPLNGHFVGLYGMGGTYDIKYQKEEGSLSNWSYSAGITYGYSTPIARRFNLEFAIGFGYIGGEYKNYTFDRDRNCYTQVEGFNRSYVGPTKAKISLVWIIGSGVTKTTKR